MSIEDFNRVLGEYEEKEQGKEKSFECENPSYVSDDDEMMAEGKPDDKSDAEEELPEEDKSDVDRDDVVELLRE